MGAGEKGRAGQGKPNDLASQPAHTYPSHWRSGGGADSHLGAWDGSPSAFCGSSFSLMSKGFSDGSVPSAAAAAAAVDTAVAAGVVPLCSSLAAR